MDYPVPAYTSFVIPTGATTGSRITFNENGNGEILVYNSSNMVVDQIGGSVGAIISYTTNPSINSSVQIAQGVIDFGDASSSFTSAASITGTLSSGGELVFDSGVGTGFTDSAQLYLVGGSTGQITGSSSAPKAQFQDSAGSSVTDVYVTGSVIHSTNSFSPSTWQTPTFGTGWADTAGFGTWPGLKWRYDAENNIHLHGAFHATVNTPTNPICTGLPGVKLYPPSGTNAGVALAAYIQGSFSMALFADSNGHLNAGSTTGVNSGAAFVVNAKIPIGNLF